MLYLLHLVFVAIYLLLPAGALAWAIRAQARGRKGAVPTMTVVYIAGLAVSLALNLVYATGTRGKPTALYGSSRQPPSLSCVRVR